MSIMKNCESEEEQRKYWDKTSDVLTAIDKHIDGLSGEELDAELVKAGHVPTEDKMSDNEKCQNEGCGLHRTEGWRDNCAHCNVKNCDLHTTTPTTSIPTAELEELRGIEAWHGRIVAKETAALQDKIAELERSLIYLAYSWDMEEDKKHKQAKEMHHCCYKAEGTTYGICAAQLCDAIDKARK